MIKRFFLSLALAAGLLSPTFGAGTIPGFSLQQQFDSLGHVLAGCQFYTIQAGTTSTPQNVYQDTALTLALPNPQTCDASGRLPQFFAADGNIKIRLTDRNGVTQVVADNVLVIGPSGGGGGGGTVDPTTILTTGDIKVTYGTGVVTGFVRANGRTIGSATSGATERANADVQALFQYLWGADANLAVSGGRGASAAADWAANKTIALPDWRGRALAGLDDMGNSAAGRLTSTYFGTSAIVLGAAGGAESKTFAQANLPSLNFPVTDPGHLHGPGTGVLEYLGTIGTASVGLFTSGTLNFSRSAVTASGTTGISVSSGGSGTPLTVASPMMLATIYLKL